MFGLSRTANSFGIILTSANLTWAPVEVTMTISALVVVTVTALVAMPSLRGRAAEP